MKPMTPVAALLALAALGAGSGRPDPYSALSSAPGHCAPSALIENGKTLYFTRADAAFTRSTVRVARLRNGVFREEGSAPFATSPYDAGASFSADGNRLFFTSLREGSGFPDPWNVWVSSRSASGEWGIPRALPSPVNGAKSDCCAVARAPRALYFSSERDGSWDIFRAELDAQGAVTSLVKLPAGINGDGSGEWPSDVDGAERYLVFSSIRKDGLGGDDLYVVFREGDGWGTPHNLGPRVNTAGFEDSGFVSPDGERFLWSSRTPKGTSTIREIGLAGLGPLFPAGRGSPNR